MNMPPNRFLPSKESHDALAKMQYFKTMSTNVENSATMAIEEILDEAVLKALVTHGPFNYEKLIRYLMLDRDMSLERKSPISLATGAVYFG